MTNFGGGNRPRRGQSGGRPRFLAVRHSLLAVALAAGGLLPLESASSPACAGDGPRAALVVSTGAGEASRFCVSLPSSSVSGIDLIELAGEQHGLSYSLGFGGEAVCMLAGVGPTGGDCFAEKPNFWGFWRGTGSGGWSWSSVGAGSVTVSDGGIHGWSWGSGTTGDTHPAPPQTTASSVCPKPKPEPTPSPDPPDDEPSGSGGTGSGGDKPVSASGGDAPRAGAAQDNREPERKAEERRRDRESREPARRRDREKRDAVVKTKEPTATDGERLVNESQPSSGGGAGPPAAALGGLAATAALTGAGFLLLRRRRVGA